MAENKPTQISFVGDEEIKKWLEDEAKRRCGISISSLLRQIIDFYRQNNHNGNGQSPVNGEAVA